jgi:hypothetical protein
MEHHSKAVYLLVERELSTYHTGDLYGCELDTETAAFFISGIFTPV